MGRREPDGKVRFLCSIQESRTTVRQNHDLREKIKKMGKTGLPAGKREGGGGGTLNGWGPGEQARRLGAAGGECAVHLQR